MKKMLQKLLVAMMCLIIVGSLVACNGGGGGGGGKSEYAGTTIELLHFWVDADDVLQDIAEEFYDETGIEVDVVFSPVASHLTDLNNRIQTDDVPEIFTMWPGPTVPPYIESGALANLSDCKWIENVDAATLSQCVYSQGGELYIAPVNTAFMGLAYNEQIFARNNLTAPKNMADFERILDVLKADPEVDYPIIMGSDCLANYVYLSCLSNLYQDMPDFDEQVNAGTTTFGNEAMTAVYEKLYIDWAEKGYYNWETCVSTDRMSKAAIEFLDGNAAIMRIGGWDMSILNELNETGTTYKMFPFPAEDNAGSVLAAAGEAFAVSAYATGAKKGAAMEFLDYLMKAENNAKICAAIGSLSPIKGAEIKSNPVLESLSAYLDQPTRGWTVWPVPVQNILGEAYDIYDAKTIEAKKSALKTFLDNMQNAWMATLEE
ncbi:MAG: carbohydrate ABC transporter substrate-binding protein [Clostridia bacterium]|nr:carbohydrate ABC transporter substrate-binding protein [Clostridia bacterium]